MGSSFLMLCGVHVCRAGRRSPGRSTRGSPLGSVLPLHSVTMPLKLVDERLRPDRTEVSTCL